MICEPLTAQPTAHAGQMYLHLCDLEFADIDGREDLEVDILLGTDHYWELVTGTAIQGSDGPTAVHTRLRWVLSGPTTGPS